MYLNRKSVWHELGLLLLYLVFSSIAFAMLLDIVLEGDYSGGCMSGMIYLFPMVISTVSTVVTAIIIIILKNVIKDNSAEAVYGFILLAISSVLCLLLYGTGLEMFGREVYLASNTFTIVVLYAVSVFILKR